MNRRRFFSAFAAIAATATFDPERLLWEPGKKLISIPPPRLRLRDLTDDNPYRRESAPVGAGPLAVGDRFTLASTLNPANVSRVFTVTAMVESDGYLRFSLI